MSKKPIVKETKIVFENYLRVHEDTLQIPPDFKKTKKYLKIEDEDTDSVIVIGKTKQVKRSLFLFILMQKKIKKRINLLLSKNTDIQQRISFFLFQVVWLMKMKIFLKQQKENC